MEWMLEISHATYACACDMEAEAGRYLRHAARRIRLAIHKHTKAHKLHLCDGSCDLDG